MEKTFQNIPFLRITIALVIGIIIGINITLNQILNFAVLLVLLTLLILFDKKYRYSISFAFGLGIHIFFIFAGIIITRTYNEKPLFFNNGNFMAIIQEKPQEKENSFKSVIQLVTVYPSDSIKPTKELIVAYFAKGEIVTSLEAGDIILFRSNPQQIENFNNPYEFDYKRYLERKRIYRQVYLPADQWIKTNQTQNSLRISAEKTREKLLQIYRKQSIDETELEILSALTLGYKRELDPETKRIFSASGASHVLAVSGLHVGIIFWVISIVFGFLRKKKSGRFLFVLISISILWIYTFITGLSPSVLRAATMFSIFVIGENINRKSNIYNSLAASAFILLLINPNNLFEVGFQLSYAAVFGIVFLQPRLEKQVVVKNKFLKFFWSLVTVSIAAQIATFPVTTFYFGQFPSYFWITNTFVIPTVMILIPLGILLLLVSKIHIISNFLAIILNLIIKSTYFILSLIDHLPFAVFEISVNQIQFIFLSATLVSILFYLKNQKVYLIKSALFFILLLSLSNLIYDIRQLNHTEVIVYNSAKNQSIHLIHAKKNYIITEVKMTDNEIFFHPGTKTKHVLGLHKPVFLNAKDTFTNNDIAVKNGLIFFEGKSFSINKSWPELNKNKLPDFIVNPAIKNNDSVDFKTNTTIISNKRFFNKNKMNFDNIHYTTMKGAFRKKW